MDGDLLPWGNGVGQEREVGGADEDEMRIRDWNWSWDWDWDRDWDCDCRCSQTGARMVGQTIVRLDALPAAGFGWW